MSAGEAAKDMLSRAEGSETKRVAFLVAPEGIERVELVEPWEALADAGHEPVLLSTQPGEVQTFDHLDKAERRPVDALVGSAQAEEYDALVLPGGVANPDALRLDADAVRFVRAFMATGRPVAAICHQPQTRRPTSLHRGCARGAPTRPRLGAHHSGLIPPGPKDGRRSGLRRGPDRRCEGFVSEKWEGAHDSFDQSSQEHA